MNNTWSLTILIPVYNEIELLRSSLDLIVSFARAHFSRYEIILIESGSTDGSGEICDAIAKENPQIKVFHEGRRKGFGSALKLGYKASRNDLIWLVTVDLPFPLTSILDALPLLESNDGVLSYRSSDPRNGIRKVLSFGYNVLMKILLGIRVRHVNSAFRVFKREKIQSLELISDGWFLDAEVLCWAHKKNFKLAEIPVPLIHRTAGTSKVSSGAPWAMLREAVKFKLSQK